MNYSNNKTQIKKTLLKFFLLYVVSVPLVNFIMGIIKLSRTDTINILEDPKLGLTIFFIIVTFIICAFLFKSTFKKEEEADLISSLLNDIFVPSTALYIIVSGFSELEDAISTAGFDVNATEIVTFDNLLSGVAIILVPVLLSILYNVGILYNKYK